MGRASPIGAAGAVELVVLAFRVQSGQERAARALIGRSGLRPAQRAGVAPGASWTRRVRCGVNLKELVAGDEDDAARVNTNVNMESFVQQ
jgi:hypothetical protein